MKNILHIYGQRICHDDVFIIGDYEGLKNLRDALNVIIGGFEKAYTESSTIDGEGYNINILCKEYGDGLNEASLPYTDKEFLGLDNTSSVGPYNLFNNIKEEVEE